MRWIALAMTISGLWISSMTSCTRSTFDADLATRPYPFQLHRTASIDIHVFRDGTEIQLVNTTATDFADFDLWLNQRYVQHVDALPAGGTLVLSLWDFRDARGETLNPGGFWQTEAPTPLRMVEIQPTPDAETIGLITIPSEYVDR